ncbi:hypothetical protein PFISCL1PPCAC_26468, partial [Pristionchus fissidentatus]
SLVVFFAVYSSVHSITCYECASGNGVDCKYAPKTCGYGLFGCVKMAVFSGGVDRMGNTYNEESKIVTMMRGCSILPLGQVDMCEQSAILGYRIIKCTCFNDFCNSSQYVPLTLPLLLLSLFYL